MRKESGLIIFTVIASSAVLLGLAFGLAKCAPGPASQYEAQQMACVAEAGTRVAADACRCAVKASFGNPCDGGTP